MNIFIDHLKVCFFSVKTTMINLLRKDVNNKLNALTAIVKRALTTEIKHKGDYQTLSSIIFKYSNSLPLKSFAEYPFPFLS